MLDQRCRRWTNTKNSESMCSVIKKPAEKQGTCHLLNARHSSDARFMLVHRERRWRNLKPTEGHVSMVSRYNSRTPSLWDMLTQFWVIVLQTHTLMHNHCWFTTTVDQHWFNLSCSLRRFVTAHNKIMCYRSTTGDSL